MTAFPIRRLMAGAFALGLGLLVSACLLSPGTFTSGLDLRKDGSFRFTYSGEIFVLSLSDFAKDRPKKKGEATFTPEQCERSDGAPRECTPDELDRQMRAWEKAQAETGDAKRKEAQQMAVMFGGFDPSDPRAGEELAAKLRQQAGWRRADYKGNGLFDVEFSLTGRLTHDFQFPLIEGLPLGSSFVHLSLRQDDTVRVAAPGYSPAAAGSPFEGIAKAAMMGESAKKDMPKLPQLDGTFTITTDGAILANNTENGPTTLTIGKRLEWRVNSRSTAAPTALVRLER